MCSQSVVPEPTAAALPGKLSRNADSQAQTFWIRKTGGETRNLCITDLPGDSDAQWYVRSTRLDDTKFS